MSVSTLLSLSLCFTMLGAGFAQNMPDRCINSPTFLVNTQYQISGDYVPAVVGANVPGESKQLQKLAAQSLEQLFAAAKEQKINLYAKSSYRAYSSQRAIFRRKVNAHKGSVEKANEYVAFPGASEHQLGLAADVTGRGDALHPNFFQTAEGQWLAENAHKFGFIIRYPLGLESITGIQYEPWHLRYVGVGNAAAITKDGLALEQYVSKKRAERYRYLLNLNKD